MTLVEELRKCKVTKELSKKRAEIAKERREQREIRDNANLYIRKLPALLKKTLRDGFLGVEAAKGYCYFTDKSDKERVCRSSLYAKLIIQYLTKEKIPYQILITNGWFSLMITLEEL